MPYQPQPVAKATSWPAHGRPDRPGNPGEPARRGPLATSLDRRPLAEGRKRPWDRQRTIVAASPSTLEWVATVGFAPFQPSRRPGPLSNGARASAPPPRRNRAVHRCRASPNGGCLDHPTEHGLIGFAGHQYGERSFDCRPPGMVRTLRGRCTDVDRRPNPQPAKRTLAGQSRVSREHRS